VKNKSRYWKSSIVVMEGLATTTTRVMMVMILKDPRRCRSIASWFLGTNQSNKKSSSNSKFT
jgi:hypothetical protein